MNLCRCLFATLLGSAPVWGGALTITGGAADAEAPILRPPASAPSDTVVLTLPGAAGRGVTMPEPGLPEPASEPAVPPQAQAPNAALPPELQREGALYFQRFIGNWKETDAGVLLGQSLRQRNAYDDDKSINGKILAFTDPTGRYKELELDFDGDSGTLRTVFVYPWKLTWQDCRRLWGANVTATEAAKGRRFYSYLNRKLDVLVDSGGKVVSLGLY